MNEHEITIGELKRALSKLPDNAKLTFAGGLTYYRLKRWGEDEFVFEFGEAQAHLTSEFKARNPHVKVAFISSESVDWDQDGKTGSVEVSLR